MNNKETPLINLCHFDVRVQGKLLPRPEESIFPLKPKLGASEVVDGCVVHDLLGFRKPRLERVLGRRVRGLDVLVPRLGFAVDLLREAGAVPWVFSPRLLSQRAGGGDVTIDDPSDLEVAPAWISVEYGRPLPPLEETREGSICRRVGGDKPMRVAGSGLVLLPCDPILAAQETVDGGAWCPEPTPGAAAVLVPHSGPIIRGYAGRGVRVLVSSPPRSDGSVDLYRVA